MQANYELFWSTFIRPELSTFFHEFCKNCLEYEEQVNKYTLCIVQFAENQNQNWNFLFR